MKSLLAEIVDGRLTLPVEAVSLLPVGVPLRVITDSERGTVYVFAEDPSALSPGTEELMDALAELSEGLSLEAYSAPVADEPTHPSKTAPRTWIADLVGTATFERLANGLAGSELQSLLLEVMHARAAARSASDLVAQYRRDPFCAPAAVDLRAMMAVDGHLLAAAERFEAIDISPVAPLGTCSVVGLTDQHRVLSALRASEVVSDPTNVLALECARRLQASPKTEVHLATSHRVLRAQPVPKLPGYAQHFRLFALASAGVERQDHAFTVDALALHARTLLAAFDRLEQGGYALGRRRVEVLSSEERRRLGDRLAALLGAEHRPLEHAYYSGGLRYRIWVGVPGGDELPLADGGSFDWLRQLASNQRAVFVGSGLGSQLIALRCGPGRAA